MVDLASIVEQVREKLNPDNSLSANFVGKCGLAQSILHFAFEDLGLEFRPLSTWSLDDCCFGHAVGVLDDREKIFLVDPTFGQFDDFSGDEFSPSEVLSLTRGGQTLMDDLINDGFFEVTPERAQLYLMAFLNGEPLRMTTEEAYNFISTPPDHEYNLRYGSDNALANRPDFEARGHIITFE